MSPDPSTSAASGLSIKEQVGSRRCEARNRPMLRAVSMEERRVIYFRPNCKSWSCPVCGQLNKGRWTALIHDGTAHLIGAGHSISFTTVTTHEKLSPQQSIALFGQQWDKLRRRAARASGGGEYVLIPERHKSGKLHAHLLDTFNLPSRWWKDNARACGLGYMAESEFARTPGGAAHYAAKYLGKSLTEEWVKNFRRIRKSQGFLNTSRPGAPEGWQVERLQHEISVLADSNGFAAAGFQVLVLDYWEVWEMMQKPEE